MFCRNSAKLLTGIALVHLEAVCLRPSSLRANHIHIVSASTEDCSALLCLPIIITSQGRNCSWFRSCIQSKYTDFLSSWPDSSSIPSPVLWQAKRTILPELVVLFRYLDHVSNQCPNIVSVLNLVKGCHRIAPTEAGVYSDHSTEQVTRATLFPCPTAADIT